MYNDCVLQVIRMSDYEEVVSLTRLTKSTRKADKHFWHEWVLKRTSTKIPFKRVSNWGRLAQYVNAGALDTDRTKTHMAFRRTYHKDEIDLFVLAAYMGVPREYVCFESMAASTKDTIVKNFQWLGTSTTLNCQLANLVYSSGFKCMTRDFAFKAVRNSDYEALKFCVERFSVRTCDLYEIALRNDSCMQTMCFIAGMMRHGK